MKTIRVGDRLVINIQIGNLRITREGDVGETLKIDEFEISGILHKLADQIATGELKLFEETDGG